METKIIFNLYEKCESDVNKVTTLSLLNITLFINNI